MTTYDPDAQWRPATPDVPAIQRELRRLRAAYWLDAGARLAGALAAAYERTLAAPLRRRRAARRTRHELARLDERTLRDIGLERGRGGEITGAAWNRMPMGLYIARAQDDLLDVTGGRIYPSVPTARHERPRDPA